MGEKIPYKARNPGGGRKKLKPGYNAGKNLKEQMDAAVILYKDGMTLHCRRPVPQPDQGTEAAYHSRDL